MAISVRDLVEKGMYLSISDREFSPIEPDGSKINAALDIFQRLIDQYRQQIPFFTEKTLNGEDELLNVDAAYVNAMDYILGNVVYNMTRLTQEEFSRVALVIGLRSIPSWFWHDQANNSIRVYPLPQSSSDKFIIGYRPSQSYTNMDEKISSSITPFMQQFLIYELAQNLCNEFNVTWTPSKESMRVRAYKMLLSNSELRPSTPNKPQLKSSGMPTPWLAYLSGNTPGGG